MHNNPPPEQIRPGTSLTEDALLRVELRTLVEHYMDIQQEAILAPEQLPAEDRSILARADSELLVTFAGELVVDSELTYSELDKELHTLDLYPLLRENPEGRTEGKQHVIHIAAYRPEKPDDLPTWPNILLFIATIISVLLTGTTIALAEMQYEAQQNPAPIILAEPQAEISFMGTVSELVSNIWRGWPYALAILLILVPHEMGHYLMMRRHHASATWPYFIPAFLISPFGTFGAAIMLRESLRSRKTLLDVGAAGPLAGFALAVPILFIGLLTSKVIPVSDTGLVEGNSLLYAFAKWIVFGEVLPNTTHDVLVNQLAWAGWTGLFVTALNMLPLGQLDGGHVVYSLFGDRARIIYWPLLIGMLALALFVSPTWLFFSVILLFVGRIYAFPLDNITPLDDTRRVIAVIALVVFALSFTPIPIYQRGEIGGLLSGISITQMSTIAVGLILLQMRLRGSQIKTLSRFHQDSKMTSYST